MSDKNAWMHRCLMVIAGLSLALAYSPFNVTWLPFVSFTLWFFAIRQTTIRESMIRSFLFCFCWFASGLSWVHISIANFGGIPLAFSLLMMAFLCAYLALFPTVSIYLWQRFSKLHHWTILPLIWLLFEYLRSVVLTGFPWLSIGYTQTQGPLAAWLPIIGETGVSGLVILVCGLIAAKCARRQGKSLTIALLVFATATVALNQIEWIEKTTDSKQVSIVQGNVPQQIRWVPEQDAPTMALYRNLTDPLWQESDIVIWPEAAIPKIEALAQLYIETVDQRAFMTKTGLITGLLDYDFDTGLAYNNVVALGYKTDQQKSPNYAYQDQSRFSKHHLLPIGEFIPFENWLRNLAPIFDLPMSSFTAGGYQQQNLQVSGWKLVPAICFEIAFPRQIRANLSHDSKAILTVSNDAWFEDSHGPHQHLQIAQARALELGLPVIRSTNNGITAIIDPFGAIVAQLPQFEKATLSYQLSSYAGTTPYRQFGDWCGFGLLSLILLIGFAAKRRTV